jgi:hypothetical protein
MMGEKWETVKRITTNFVSSVPAALVALPAAYGSAMFSKDIYGEPFNWSIGIGIEASYIGLVLFARKKSYKTFLTTALAALVCGVIYNTLHAAEVKGLLENQGTEVLWLLAFVHGAPLSILGFSYFMLLHRSSDVNFEVSKNEISNPVIADKPESYIIAPPSADGGNPNVEINLPFQPSSSEIIEPLRFSKIVTFQNTSSEISVLYDEITKLVRQLQRGDLGVKDFEKKLEEYLKLNEMSNSTLFDEINKSARQVQRRELKIGEFDKHLFLLLTGD